MDGVGYIPWDGKALSTRECNSSSVVREQAVRRLKRMRVNDIVKNKGVPIKFYCPLKTRVYQQYHLKTNCYFNNLIITLLL